MKEKMDSVHFEEGFKEGVKGNTKEFNHAKNLFKVGDKVHIPLTGSQFTVVTVVRVRKNDFTGDDGINYKLIDLIGKKIKLTRDSSESVLVEFEIEAIANIAYLYRWNRLGMDKRYDP